MKMFAGFFSVIVLTGAIVLLSVDRLSELDSILIDAPRKLIPEVEDLLDVKALLTGMETDLRHVMLDNEADRHLALIAEKDKAIGDALNGFRALHDPGQPTAAEAELLARAMRGFRSLHGAMAGLAALVATGDLAEARATLFEKWEPAHQATMQGLDRLLIHKGEVIKHELAAAGVQGFAGDRSITWLAWWSLIFCVVLALAITYSLTKPITSLIEATERVTRGDLDSKAEILSNDEIGLLARRFNQMLERLGKLISDQRRFYADISHELRTPLTVIRGEAEVTLRGSSSEVDYREALATINAVAGQMGSLVDELLFLTRSDSGEIQYQMSDVLLVPLLREVTRQGSAVAELKSVSLDLEVDDGSAVIVLGDGQRLRQLFHILVDNAIKYTAADGKVSLALAAERGTAAIKIADTGVGIPEHDLPRIFERFFRGDAAAETKTQGIGLGLSIAKSIVDAHGGDIDFESKVGRGTTVTVWLTRPRFR